MNWRPLLLLPPVGAGVAAFFLLTSREPRPVVEPQERATAVEVMVLEPRSLDPFVDGYGHVAPARTFRAVAEVSGRIASLHPDLAVGSILPAGAVIVTFDDRDLVSNANRAQANLRAARAQVDELRLSQTYKAASLDLERELTSLTQADFARKRALYESGSLSQALLDLENAIALLPTQIARLEASEAARKIEEDIAQRDLANAHILLPFAARVSSLSVEADQFVRSGEQIATFHDASASDIEVHVQPRAFASFLTLAGADGWNEGIHALEAAADGSGYGDQVLSLVEALAIRAVVVTQGSDGLERYRSGNILRFLGESDAATGTIAFVVRIEDPLRIGLSSRQRTLRDEPEASDPKTGADVAEGNRTPLLNGAFTKVRFTSTGHDEKLVIPLSALHQNDAGEPVVHVVNESDRLEIVPVTLGPAFGDLQVITGGAVEGDQIIISRPAFVFEGMKLNRVEPANAPT